MLHVFGSLNMDLVCQTPRLPVPGETVLGAGFSTVPGGKGANQAVAAARLGAAVRLVGRVGDDQFGQRLRAGLVADGVTAEVAIAPAISSGVAAIAVDQAGRNQIIVVPGANGLVDASDVARLAVGLGPGDTLLLQFELPLAAVVAAAKAARDRGLTVIVDPAPAQPDLPSALLAQVNWLTPNQSEAEQLVGFAVPGPAEAAQAAALLRQRGVPQVAIKLGEAGVWIDTGDRAFHLPAFQVPVVDTVAAGDAFNAGLAVALAEGQPLRAAVRFASAAAALTVSQAGAQPALPQRPAVEQFLAAQPL